MATVDGGRPAEAAIAAGTWSTAVSVLRSTRCTAGNAGAARQATSTASRVLPTPPTPVTVTSRTAGSRTFRTSASRSSSRPSSDDERGRHVDALVLAAARGPGRRGLPGQPLERGPVSAGQAERGGQGPDGVPVWPAGHPTLQIADRADAHVGVGGEVLLRQPALDPQFDQQVGERDKI